MRAGGILMAAILVTSGTALAQDPQMIDGFPCRKVWVFPNPAMTGCETDEVTIAAGTIPSGSKVSFRAGKAQWLKLSRTTMLSGVRCRGFFDIETYLYPGGELRGCWLSDDQKIEGVPCMRTTVSRARWHGRRGTVGGTWFHKNGRLQQCDAARAFTIRGVQFKKGETVLLTPDGEPVPDARAGVRRKDRASP